MNAATDKIDVPMKYDGVKQIAHMALDCQTRYPDEVVMMTGDVSGAFRNVPFAAFFCGCFAGYIRELDIIVVNLCLPFGWTDSPAYYWLAGRAIKTLHNSRSGYKNLTYCDDHILLGRRGTFRTQAAAFALRRSMVLVLGTQACNEKKFTVWDRQCKALGLIFDLDTMAVSMPEPKIAKIVGRLLALLNSKHVTVKQLNGTMGLIRYLGTCIPVARPFYNRLQAFLGVLQKVTMPLKLPNNQIEDIKWLLALFQTKAFQGISMRRLAGVITPHEVINMDASDLGGCGVCGTQEKPTLLWNGMRRKIF